MKQAFPAFVIAHVWMCVCVSSAAARIVEVNTTATISSGQITADRWDSDVIDFSTRELEACDTLRITVTFDSVLFIEDNLLDDMEQLWFRVNAKGGTGGGMTHDLAWKWKWVGQKGDAPADSITGNGCLSGNNGVTQPAEPFLGLCLSLDVDANVTTDTLEVRGIVLEMKTPSTISTNWKPTSVQFSVDADDMEVRPPPKGGGPLVGGCGECVPARIEANFKFARNPGRRVSVASSPNPSAGVTTIHYSLLEASGVRVSVHDIHGRVVRDLSVPQFVTGSRSVPWDGLQNDGRAVQPGIYFCRVTTANAMATTKLVRR